MTMFMPDRAHVIAVAIHLALNGDFSLLLKLEQEQTNLWNGWGI